MMDNEKRAPKVRHFLPHSESFSMLTHLKRAFIIAPKEAGASCGPMHYYIRTLQELNFSFVFQGKDS
jgi:hypothetical protein